MNLKYGVISSIENEKVLVFITEDNILLDKLHLLNGEYKPPKVGEEVVCIVDKDGSGLCLKGYFRKETLPPSDVVYQNKLTDQINISVTSEGLVIEATNIILKGDVNIQGNLNVTGKIDASGTVTAGGVVLS